MSKLTHLIDNELTPLSVSELSLINGGGEESGWYWLMYYAGQAYHSFAEKQAVAHGNGHNPYHSAG